MSFITISSVPGAWLLAGALVLGMNCALAADSVRGSLTVTGKTYAPSHVAAFRVRDPQNPRTLVTYVMLTSSPVNGQRIAEAYNPYLRAINDPAVEAGAWIGLWVDAQGTVKANAQSDGVQYLASSGQIMGEPGVLSADCTTNTAVRVACTVKTLAPVKVNNGQWTLDVRFESVIQARKPGSALPTNGGEPGQSFLALVRATTGTDLDAILQHLPSSKAEDYRATYLSPEENLESAKTSLDFLLPKQPQITGGESVDADTALLEVEGQPWEDSKMLYLVEMKREGGRWVFVGVERLGMFD